MKRKIIIIPLLALLLSSCVAIQINPQSSNTSFSSLTVSNNNIVSSETISSSIELPSSVNISSNNVSSETLLSSSNEPISSVVSSIQPSSAPQSSSAPAPSSIQPSSVPLSSVPQSSSIPSSSSLNSSSSEPEDTIVNLELFALNDMHGNVYDSDTGLGIAKTSTLLKTYPNSIDNTIYISQGDMWQGSAVSNITRGQLVNDWMNQMGFISMTVGNHEFDWSTSYVKTNSESANFPFLGINVYDRTTDQRVDYLKPSTVINKNGAKIGVIGAIGDCYSSISGSMVQDIYFKVGDDLTSLVKEEATRLRNEELCDFIIYSLHEDDSNYDVSLSKGYVDLVLEGHSHQNYARVDSEGVYHIQSSGYNKTINYINIDLNITKDTFVINNRRSLYTNNFSSLEEDAAAKALFTKYADAVTLSEEVLGYNSSNRTSYYLRQLVADLYLEYGKGQWGSAYNIFLAGGYISCRSPYKLEEGMVTYADVYTLFPFDNTLVLCSISGYYLDKQFVTTENENYYIAYTDYGNNNRYSIDTSQTYYVITDTYSSDYASNHLTVIARYPKNNFYARDMVAQYIRDGYFA